MTDDPVARWHRRGHAIVAFEDRRWRWEDSGTWLMYGSGPLDPPCALCGREPTDRGYDPCLGEVPGAISACCGHGVVNGHVTYISGEMMDLPRLQAAPSDYPYRIPRAGDADEEADDRA